MDVAVETDYRAQITSVNTQKGRYATNVDTTWARTANTLRIMGDMQAELLDKLDRTNELLESIQQLLHKHTSIPLDLPQIEEKKKITSRPKRGDDDDDDASI